MKFAESLVQSLAGHHLLKHPFYIRWTKGELTVKDLRYYATQYFHHVEAFPRYVSATHSLGTNIKERQILLRNLNEEENGEEHHPELWMRFAEGLGASRDELFDTAPRSETVELVDTFFELCRSSFSEGLGALFAYEYQIPEIAGVKIDGLMKFYGINAPSALQFFEVHREADVWHSHETGQLMGRLTQDDQERAERAAFKAAQALWKFLDGVNEETLKKVS